MIFPSADQPGSTPTLPESRTQTGAPMAYCLGRHLTLQAIPRLRQ